MRDAVRRTMRDGNRASDVIARLPRAYLTIIRGMRCCQEGRTLGARRQCSSPYTTTSNNASGLPGSNPQGRDFRDRISALFVACLVRLNGAPHALNCAPGNPVAPVNDYEIGSRVRGDL